MARSKREVPATLVPWHSDRSALMAAAQCTTQSTPSKARAIAASSLISPCACSTARVGSMRRTNAFAVAPSRSSLGSRVAPRAPLAPVTSARLPCSAGIQHGSVQENENTARSRRDHAPATKPRSSRNTLRTPFALQAAIPRRRGNESPRPLRSILRKRRGSCCDRGSAEEKQRRLCSLAGSPMPEQEGPCSAKLHETTDACAADCRVAEMVLRAQWILFAAPGHVFEYAGPLSVRVG
jgi:hypothetical protein